MLLLRRLTYVCGTVAVPAFMGREREFERAYGRSGEWTRLFQRGEGYLGTELLQRSEDPREYLALDRWASGAAYDAFRARFSNEYQRLDRRFEELTDEETLLGTFEALF
jgi:heme-degrading monooxygenase HmoA